MDETRRALLMAAGAATVLTPALTPGLANAEPTAKPGDFDFLAGEWRIQHRQRVSDTADWVTFEGEATCWTILNGVGSVEELRIPAKGFSGMGLRLLDIKEGLWNDYWTNGKSGVLGYPGLTGRFENGVGTFIADDMDGDKPVKAAGVWDQITGKSHRWRQAISRDGGKTWADTWVMDWRRA